MTTARPDGKPARVSERCSCDISFGLFGRSRDSLARTGSGVSTNRSSTAIRLAPAGCAIARMRRRSGEFRASTHDVVVPTTTHIATKTPTTARRTSGAIALVLHVQDPPDPHNADRLQHHTRHNHLHAHGIVGQKS